MKNCVFKKCNNAFSNIQSIAILLPRLLIAYGFYETGLTKWGNEANIAQWFAGMNIPLPLLSAYLTSYFELIGAVLLALGLFTRYISLPLIFIIIVAIITVHLPHGFSVANNGYEIPLYYLLFLIFFVAFGGGKISIDYLIKRKMNENITA